MALLFLIITNPLFAKESNFIYSIRQEYLSTRAMGMGNAYTAVVENSEALYFNPAALSLLQSTSPEFIFTFGQVASTVGDNSFKKLYDDISTSSKKGSSSDRTSTLANLIESKYGKSYSARLHTLSALYGRKGFAMGFIPIDLTANLFVHQQIGPTIILNAYEDSSITLGYGVKLSNALAIGVSAKSLYRIYYYKNLPAIELANNSTSFHRSQAQEGVAFDADLALLYTLPSYPVSLGVHCKNLLDQGPKYDPNIINSNSNAGMPPKLARRVDFGMKAEFAKIWKARLRPLLSADIRDSFHPNWSLRKGIHLGSELSYAHPSYPLALALRTGLGQLYLSYGFSLKLFWFTLEYARYGEEVGTRGTHQQNRTDMLRVALIF
ncbi:MAG: hypothetical protein HQK50_01375 [Oligoflexia bacterium]|nr:hypothetical protein [Oligoflexia bacterium]